MGISYPLLLDIDPAVETQIPNPDWEPPEVATGPGEPESEKPNALTEPQFLTPRRLDFTFPIRVERDDA